MAKGERSFASKMKKDKKITAPIDPETGEPIQFVRFVKMEKSPETGTFKTFDKVVGVRKSNQKEIWG